MFNISGEQRNSLEKETRATFHGQLYDRLEGSHCEAIRKQPKTEVLKRMVVWHQRGLSYGLESRKAIGRFLGMHLTILPDFDAGEPMQEVLHMSELSGDQKMEALFIRLRRQDRGAS